MIELKAYEGLIRNHAQLADELGLSVEGCSRAEREERIVVAAYEAWGANMGAHINGQFAIALYDTEAECLFCTRDPLGAELLFYYETSDGRLLVGTQIKDLFDQQGFVKAVNAEMIQFFLAFNYVPGEETLFKGVFKLEPGGYLTFDANELTLGRYWELTFEPDESKSLDDWADELESAMEASLRDICDDGEEPDSFLSGGVDSSYILAKSKAKTGYCVAYDNQKASEEDDARQTAEFLGRGFEGIRVTPEQFFANVDEFLLAYEQPSSDVAGLSLFCAAKTVAEKSTVCFSGEGADEFFAGYSVYQNTARLRYNPDPVYYGSTYILSPKEQRWFLKDFHSERSTRDFIKQRGAEGRKYDLLTWMLYVELKSYFEGSILFNSTKIARGTGLDIRMPYCDLRIFDIARRMPSRFKTTKENNKIALRSAASRVLPREVAYRKKLGFPEPVREWLHDEAIKGDIRRAFEIDAAQKFCDMAFSGSLLDAFEGRKPRVHALWLKRRQASLWRYVWTVYVFIRWYELFFED